MAGEVERLARLAPAIIGDSQPIGRRRVTSDYLRMCQAGNCVDVHWDAIQPAPAEGLATRTTMLG